MSRDTLVTHFFHEFGYILWQTRSIYAVLFSLIVLGGCIVGYAEGLPLFEGIYFAIITGLTIGYGDIVPVTTVGRILALILGLVGVVFTGMIVATAVHALREAADLHREGGIASRVE